MRKWGRAPILLEFTRQKQHNIPLLGRPKSGQPIAISWNKLIVGRWSGR